MKCHYDSMWKCLESWWLLNAWYQWFWFLLLNTVVRNKTRFQHVQQLINALISGHPRGLVLGNPRAFAPRHCQIPPTQGQYSSTKSYHCPSPGEHNLKKISLEHGLLLRRHHSDRFLAKNIFTLLGMDDQKRGQIYQRNIGHAYVSLCRHFGSRSTRSASFISKMTDPEMLQIPRVFPLVSCLGSTKVFQCPCPEPKMSDKSQQIPPYSTVCPRGQPPGMAADKCISWYLHICSDWNAVTIQAMRKFQVNVGKGEGILTQNVQWTLGREQMNMPTTPN